jgi:iron(III) transport system substrate-binding protein
MRTLANVLAATILASAVLIAQSSAGLLDRARREGSLTLYTSLAPTESQPLANAFEKKYGVKVQLWRGQSDEVVQRVVTEAKGRRFAVDVVETNGPEMEMIAREKLLGELQSAYVSDLPANAIPAHRTWFPDRMNYFVVGYNTAKVKRGDIPATYEGFTDPKWKGRIALEATDAEWMATLIKTSPGNKGTDIVRKIAALQPSLRKGHVLLASLVAAGEVPIGLAMYNSNIETLKRKGAPIDYVPVQPVVARPQGIGVARSAPHPNAAILFAEFVLSPDGQQLFESMGRVPASTKIKSEFNKFPFVVIDPVTVLDEAAKWEQVWNDLFVKR